MPAKLFRISTGRGYLLAGLLSYPKRLTSASSVVIIAHGLGVDQNYHLIRSIRQGLLSAGAIALTFDFAGHGSSGGRIADRLVRNFVRDIGDVVKYIEKDAPLRSRKKIIIGHSIGALVGLCYTATHPVAVSGLCIIGCNAYAARKYHQLEQQGRLHVFKRYIRIGGAKVARNFWTDRIQYEPAMFVKKIAVPTLILCGRGDITNPPAESEQIGRWLHTRKQLVFVSGADHYFRTKRLQGIVVSRIRHWLETAKTA